MSLFLFYFIYLSIYIYILNKFILTFYYINKLKKFFIYIRNLSGLSIKELPSNLFKLIYLKEL